MAAPKKGSKKPVVKKPAAPVKGGKKMAKGC